MYRLACLLSLVLACLLAHVGVTFAGDSPIVVRNTHDSGPGSLRAAIAAADSGDTILLPGNLQGPITLTSGQLVIDKSLDILATPGQAVTISGNDDFRVFDITSSSATVTLFGLTITNGHAHGFAPGTPEAAIAAADASGGGIRNSGTLTVSECSVSSNSAGLYGGGIFNLGTLTVSDCTLSGNYAVPNGGGIFNLGTLTVSDCTLSDNIVEGSGGAIFNLLGTVTVSDSTLSFNFASLNAGGIGDNFGTVTVNQSTLSDNFAGGSGGGIGELGGTLTVGQSILSGNDANGNGGGIFIPDGTATVSDSTLTDNTAVRNGGGIFNGGTLSVLDYSDICGNHATNGADLFNLGDYDKDESSTVCVIFPELPEL